MKAAVQALWYLCVGIGNVLVAVIAKLDICSAYCQFFMYAGRKFFFMGIFMLIAMRYTYTAINYSGGTINDADNANNDNINDPTSPAPTLAPSSSFSDSPPLSSPRIPLTPSPRLSPYSSGVYSAIEHSPPAHPMGHASGRYQRPFKKQISTLLN